MLLTASVKRFGVALLRDLDYRVYLEGALEEGAPAWPYSEVEDTERVVSAGR